MVDRRRACCGASLALLLTWFVCLSDRAAPTVLQAVSPQAFQDLDGDFLPDALEHVLLLDPLDPDTTDDGVGDFLHAVQSRLPDGSGDPTVDHEFRVCVTEHTQPNGSSLVWVHYLARIVDNDLSGISRFEPFLDIESREVPIGGMIASAPLCYAQRLDPQEGLFVRLSFCLGSPDLLAQNGLLPCTVGARVEIGGLPITSGMFVRETSGVLTGLVPIDAEGLGLQTLESGGNDDPFWRSNRVCRLRLALVGVTNGGVVCEITETYCVVDPTRRLSCPPSCESTVGRVLFIPDGLRTITGGND